jgi:hypothetical protein
MRRPQLRTFMDRSATLAASFSLPFAIARQVDRARELVAISAWRRASSAVADSRPSSRTPRPFHPIAAHRRP